VQDAVRCPSPASLAALDEQWPHAWIEEEEAVGGVPRDRRKGSLIAETAGARQDRSLELGAGPGCPGAASADTWQRLPSALKIGLK
jgi:hypothetical protein